jgi:hypothetical protein
MLRTVVETAVSILKLYQTTLDAGEMTLEDAKKQAYATLTRKEDARMQANVVTTIGQGAGRPRPR